ncbi:hypothetical protein N7451_000308, partial [Penicillium sp. IBT 35674x]
MDSQNPPFPIPERISSLMPPSRQKALSAHQERSVSTASKISQISQTSVASTVSDFLEAKITALEDESTYIGEIRAGLDEAQANGALANDEYRRQLDPFLSRVRSNISTLHVLKRQRNMLEEELSDTLATEKKQRQHGPTDHGLLQRAYTDTIITRVMKADGKQQALSFKSSRFKADVNAYYDAKDKTNPDLMFCHVLGTHFDKRTVKAAHLVPKSMTREELAHLFGDEDAVITLPQNGLSLHHKVESLLDKGEIAIIQMPGRMTTPTTWQCVVLDESLNNNIIFQHAGTIIRVQDLDGRRLTFKNDNRPRRRYLYMRFIISYLWAKRRDLPTMDEKVEARKFWPSGGAYLQKSTLQTLARCVSGCKIPENLIADQTFEGSSDTAKDTEVAMVLAADIRDHQRGPDVVGAITDTIKH